MVTVYVLQGNLKRYVGITNNLVRRLAEHRQKKSAVLKNIGVFILLHSEQFPDYDSARKREKFLKSGKGREFVKSLNVLPRSAEGG
jgi:putative endonuclease